ncbi:MAG: hypothetical protein ABS939_14920, partial [Psychrobacillus sp.]
LEYIEVKVERGYWLSSNSNPVDSNEMKRRQDLDEIASLNMIGEGCPFFDEEEKIVQEKKENK